MAGAIEIGASALVMDSRDHVATAIKDLQAGEVITYLKNDQKVELIVVDHIPFGHKIAIEALEEGVNVRKYGEVIGRTTTAITIGQHVHIHNVEGIRGRGDQTKVQQQGGEA